MTGGLWTVRSSNPCNLKPANRPITWRWSNAAVGTLRIGDELHSVEGRKQTLLSDLSLIVSEKSMPLGMSWGYTGIIKHGVSSELAAHFTATFYVSKGIDFRYDLDRAIEEGLNLSAVVVVVAPPTYESLHLRFSDGSSQAMFVTSSSLCLLALPLIWKPWGDLSFKIGGDWHLCW